MERKIETVNIWNVKINRYEKVEKKDCIFDAGKWKRKIDYCMDKLGAKKVTEILRSELKIKESNITGDSWGNLSKYPQVLQEMIQLADTA